MGRKRTERSGIASVPQANLVRAEIVRERMAKLAKKRRIGMATNRADDHF